jgi:hypothetical protein
VGRMPTTPASQLPRPSHPPARRRVAWTVVILLPLAIAGLFLFHFIVVSAGAAGGCGGG